MKQDTQSFARACKAGSPESQLAEAYNRALANFESIQSGLLKCLRVEKTSKGLVPVFAPEAEGFAADLKEAEQRLKDVKVDIEAFLTLTGGEPSLNNLTERLVRARRHLADVNLAAQNVLKAEMRRNNMSVAEAEALPAVQAALDKRDRMRSELEPQIGESQHKISQIKAILEKY